MMLWKNLKAGTIVDACIGVSRRRAEKIEAAALHPDRPATGERAGAETGKPATESLQPAE